MDLTLTDEQEAVRATFADFFAKESPATRVRTAEPLGFDPALWQALSLTGAVVMGVPEDLGGGSATTLDLVLVAQEFGRRLAPVPFAEAAAAASVLGRAATAPPADGELIARLLAEIAGGSLVPAFSPRPAADGVVALAPAGGVAGLLVALDDDDLVAVHRTETEDAASVPRNLGSAPLASRNLRDRRHQRITLASGARARELHAAGAADWRLLTAAALDGLRDQALAMAVAYVKERHAFGVPIGQFQAIQHRLAEVAAAGEGLRLLVYEAGWAAGARPPAQARPLATMAFLAAKEIAFATCREALQFHGGYGYTLEYDIQLYFRRAKAWPLAAGPTRDAYQLLAGQLFDVTD